jgi:hypothetical protein
MPDCVSVRTSDHLVHISNGCPKVVACRVTTSVNPEPIDVDVPPGTTADVLTFRGSPARTFEASVSCVPRG